MSRIYRAAPPSRFPTGNSVDFDYITAEGPSASSSNGTRPIRSYEWVMRRWIKGSDASIIGLVKSNAGNLLSATESMFTGLDSPIRNPMLPNGTGYVEVKFEWTRGKGAKARAREKQMKRERAATLLAQSEGVVAASDGGGDASTLVTPPTPTLAQEFNSIDAASQENPAKIDLRPSLDSRSSSRSNIGNAGGRASPPTSTSPTSSGDGQPQKSSSRRSSRSRKGRRNSTVFLSVGGGDDDGEDSDPEDSETPWTCIVWMSQFGDAETISGRPSLSSEAGTSSSQHYPNPTDGDAVPLSPTAATSKVKVKVAAMTPAPHHPKVVSQLKMPYPLPDLDVDRCEVVYQRGGRDRAGGLVLTAEEIKDVVCVTALWLAVKEGFGGLDTRRKGDGWKIRG